MTLPQSAPIKTLNNVQAGDKVVIYVSRWGTGSHRLMQVARTTKTQIIIMAERFKRSDGYMIGSDSYTTARIVTTRLNNGILRLMTPEEGQRLIDHEKIQAEIEELAKCLSRLNPDYLKTLPIETLKEAARLLGLEEAE